jgi:O2-independent ubiquinone biosynthesis protein UbiV
MAMTTAITLGPVLFNWPAETWRDFHFRMADEAPIDAAHIGEVVCMKREVFLEPHLEAVAQRYRRAGKQIVLSSLALVVNTREAAAMRELAEADGALVEVNDMGLVASLSGRPFVVGPTVNVYNEGTLGYLEQLGAIRVCPPPELPRASLAALARSARAELEIFAFGRLPLAMSARCFHARVHGLTRDSCRFVCGEDADGLETTTLDGEAFVAINGTQVLSHACVNLLSELREMTALGLRRFRLSPQSVDMVLVAHTFRDALDGRLDAEAGAIVLSALAPRLPFANGFYRGGPGHLYVRQARAD